MSQINIGGQALIEGVMIRAPERYSCACRKSSGEIVVKGQDYIPVNKRKKLLNLPVVRGFIGLFEMMAIGIKSLNFSAEIAGEDEKSKKKEPAKWQKNLMSAVSFVLALGIAISVFFYLPLLIATILNLKQHPFWFNMVTGVIRVIMFVLYVWFLSFFKDFKRLFQYHGAEHMSIYAFENGEELTLENIKKYSTLHPRCGTSFLFLLLILAILIYSVADSLYFVVAQNVPILAKRFLFHLLLLPVVAGVSYEILKLSSKTKDNFFTRILIAPGLWLQKITTQRPSEDQIEVAVAALENAVGIKTAAPLVEEA